VGAWVKRSLEDQALIRRSDIPHLDILLVGDFDDAASPFGGKGLGELTAVSVAPIANATP